MEAEEELKNVCEEIAKLPFHLNPSKKAQEKADKLWSKKRELLAKLNHHNTDKYA